MEEKTNLEISRTTILNLPVLVWENIRGQFLKHPENELLNLCLASSMLDAMITEDLRKPKWMEQVLPLLTKDLYLNQVDLENLIETESDYLGKFAAISWISLNRPKFEIVDLNNEKMVRKFEENVEAKKKKNQIWAAFAGKTFSFVAHKIGSIRPLLEKHRKYFLFVQVMEYVGKASKGTTSFIKSGKLSNLRNISFERKVNGAVYFELLSTIVDQTTESRARGKRLIERYRRSQAEDCHYEEDSSTGPKYWYDSYLGNVNFGKVLMQEQ